MQVEFCLPVKNEEQILAANVGRLYNYLLTWQPSFSWRLVILVNGSQDASATISANLSQNNSRIKWEESDASGKGQALKSYFLNSPADILVFMDIDLAVSLDNLDKLIQPLLSDQADLTLGSRLLATAQTDRSFFRSFVSRAYNQLSRLLLGHGFSDLQCGFKAIKKSLFLSLAYRLRDPAWFFDTELVIWSKYVGARIKELPVNWQENRYDKRKSKIRVMTDVWPFIVNLCCLRQAVKSARFLDRQSAYERESIN